MLTLVKLVQSLVKALHSEGTPGPARRRHCSGLVLRLTPLVSLHNAVVFAAVVLLNVSFPGAMLGWALFVPVGFLLDPLFDAIGRRLLLDTPALTPLWTTLYNTPVVPLTNFNNTVTLGSLVFSVVVFLPLFIATRWAVTRYRATIGERVRQSQWYRAVTASKLYNVYRLFRPEA